MSKQFDYVITLKKGSVLPVNIICQLLLLISLAIFGLIAIRSFQFHMPNYLYLVLFILVAAWWVYCFVSRRRKPYYRLALLLSGIGWILAPLHKLWIGILFIAAGLLEKQVKFPSEIGVDKEGIIINSLPRKSYPWSEIKNMLIKDNILTIDFKSNKLLQREIDEDVSYYLEHEFNEYCQRYLSKHV